MMPTWLQLKRLALHLEGWCWSLLLRIPERATPRWLRCRALSYSAYTQELLDPHWGLPAKERTTLPTGERIRFQVVLAVELYTPVHARALAEGLERLGLRRSVFGGESSADSIREHRASVGRSASNLGVLVPKGQAWSGMVPTELPAGVRAVFLWSHQLTPSVTAVVASCALDDPLASSLEPLLGRTDFPAIGQREGKGWSIQPPANVKRLEVENQHAAIRLTAAHWLASRVPGAFASGGDASIPTIAVIVVDDAEPFAKDADNDFLDFIHLGWEPGVLRSQALPGWGLSFGRNERARATMAGRRSEVLDPEDLKHSSEGWYLAQQLQEGMLDDMALWGASELLVEAQRRIASVRDDLPAERSKSVLRRLKRMRGVFLSDSLDTRTIADELGAYANAPPPRSWMSADWRSDETNWQWSLNESLGRNLTERSAILKSSEQRLREAISAETNIISAIANLRAQRYFGWAALVVTVLVALHPNFRHLMHRVQHVGFP